jgi:diguanylate cyclase (GGDEF)-like protein
MSDSVHIPDDSRPVVLIIDDSKDVHRLLKARLRTEDIDFVSAETGDEGVAIAAERHPALILLDLDMPDMDGFEVLRKLKENKETLNISVVVLSGMNSSQDKVTAFDLGAVDYITKPFDLAELRVRIRSALRMHSLVKMLAQRAQVDGLTGLWNRAHFERRWAEEFSRSQRNHRPLSVAMIDADNFKSVNDTYGHPAGDAVLQGIAKLLNKELRTSDVACRYGGEEFVVILSDTGPDGAFAICDRIRALCEAIVWPKHPERRVTISFGVAASFCARAGSAEAWVELADSNLYLAKRTGRNRVVVSDAEDALSKNPPDFRLAG